MQAVDVQLRTRALFGPGILDRVGAVARELGFGKTLLVSDPGIVAAGHFARAAGLIRNEGIEVVGFHDFGENPDTDAIDAGRRFAASRGFDSLIGLGGGSSMDCAKGINFLLTNGGTMSDYWGHGKASLPMLPMIGVPTTAGTGSEAQSYALIADADTHIKMACGDPKAAFHTAILDAELTVTQPALVRARAGYDAISHAVETWVTTKCNDASAGFSREAATLLFGAFEHVLERPEDVDANGRMLLGAFYAGAAIEHSMLGAAHACANPLTIRHNTEHGAAVAHMLAHVVRWNGNECSAEYAALGKVAGLDGNVDGAAEALARRLESLAAIAGLSTRLRDVGVSRAELPELAEDAAKQWTGKFNPRPFDAEGALEIYECAY